jgi:SAM-dependent methyltransferase
MKDNFSTQSDKYARYRPSYPAALFEFLLSIVPAKQHAWDCGTGNGQLAHVLAKHFDKVYATDISPQQIENAIPVDKIVYSVQQAEQTTFADNFFDLITVAQAIHWFDFHQFYREVNRTIKDKGILAVTGYGLLQTAPEIDAVIVDFYHNIVGAYRDREMRYIDEGYQTIPFPFEELKTTAYEMELVWTLEHLIGFLETWSAVKHFREEKGQNPIHYIDKDLKRKWGKGNTRTVRFPLFLRVARIEKNISKYPSA